MEAKEIRKAKQIQIENEIQEHEERQQTQHGYLYSLENENTSLRLNSMISDQTSSKFLRLDHGEKDDSSNDVGSRRSSADSSFHGNYGEEQANEMKPENYGNNPMLLKKEKSGNSWYHKDGLSLGAPSSHPPTSLFNEEDSEHFPECGSAIKTERIKSESGDWSTLDILLNRRDDEEEEDDKSTLELVGDNEDNGPRDFSSVDDDEEDLVSECMSQSQNPFPNVDELVSGLAPFPSTANISHVVMGSSKTVIYPNNLMGSQSPISSQTCSSIAS